MNAYELANELSEFMTEDEYTELDKTIFKAVTMLRQQADRIAELEKQNKPIGVYDGKRVYITTPQTKPLSDEEITEIAEKTLGHSMGLLNWMGFAKAILRKA